MSKLIIVEEHTTLLHLKIKLVVAMYDESNKICARAVCAGIHITVIKGRTFRDIVKLTQQFIGREFTIIYNNDNMP